MPALAFVEQSLPVSQPVPRLRTTREPYEAAQDRRDFQVWSEAMKDGYYQLGWAINDLRSRHWPSAHSFWKCEKPFQGQSISLAGLHGLGDVIQMMRFVPHLQQLGCKVRCFTRSELMPIMPMFSGMEEVECNTLDRLSVPAEGCNAIELMELPYLLRAVPNRLPSDPYLHVPAAQIRLEGERMGSHRNMRVGIVWTGSAHDPERWVPIGTLNPLFQIRSIEWWNMQGGSAAQDALHPSLRHAASVLSTTQLDSFCALLANLDLLVTADTLAAHLAGAMGLPVWLLLKHDADWRWMRQRSTSPWYPTARLFRQHRAGDWTGVVAQIRQEAERL